MYGVCRLAERARTVFAIEREMSFQERSEPRNQYWIEIDGARFVQVEDFDKEHFRSKKLRPDPPAE